MCRYCGVMWILAAMVTSFVAVSIGLNMGTPAVDVRVASQNAQPQRATERAQQRQRALRNPEIITVDDVVYATVEVPGSQAPIDLTMDTAFARQSDGEPMPVVVYIHGGGFRSGSKSDGQMFNVALARGGYFAAAINYRLSDIAEYPAAVHDCKAAIRFLRSNAEELAIDPDRIGVWGHSAGGHLAAYLALTGNAEETHGTVGTNADTSSAVQCAVPVSGIFDFSEIGNGGERMRYWLGSAEGEAWTERLREASPISWVDSEDPPMLLIHGTEDRLVQAGQSETLHAKLQSDGVETRLRLVDDQGHIIRDRRVYMEAMQFFDKHLGGHAAQAGRSQRQSPQVRDIPS